eukprot:14278576-Alexandrium_andersonii.AAC.1
MCIRDRTATRAPSRIATAAKRPQGVKLDAASWTKRRRKSTASHTLRRRPRRVRAAGARV